MIGFYKINTRHQTKKVLFAILALNAFAPYLSFANDVDQQIPPNEAPFAELSQSETASSILKSLLHISTLQYNLVEITSTLTPSIIRDTRLGARSSANDLFTSVNLDFKQVLDFFRVFNWAILKTGSKEPKLTVLGEYIVNVMFTYIKNEQTDPRGILNPMTVAEIRQWLIGLESEVLTVSGDNQQLQLYFQDITLLDHLQWAIRTVDDSTQTLRTKNFSIPKHMKNVEYGSLEAFLQDIRATTQQSSRTSFLLARLKKIFTPSQKY